MLSKITKIKIIVGTILLTLIIFCCWFFWPHSLIDSTAIISNVKYYNEDITDQVDKAELLKILADTNCYRDLDSSVGSYFPYEEYMQIWVICDNGPIFFLLGNENSAMKNSVNYCISNAEDTINAIEMLTGYAEDSQHEDKTWALAEENVITFSDGESANLWRRNDSGNDVYKLSDGTTLLTIQASTGPDNTYVVGLESFDDLSEYAQKAVCAFYEEQGLLYDTQSELENAYAEYLTCKENGTEYYDRMISQDIVPTASNDHIMCFLTSVILPMGAQVVQEIQLGAVFDRNTGEVLSIWDLFTLPEEEARQWLLNAFDVADPVLRAEMEAALKPEYIILSSEGLEVTFPKGTLPSQENSYSIGLDYTELQFVLQTWVVPDN